MTPENKKFIDSILADAQDQTISLYGILDSGAF